MNRLLVFVACLLITVPLFGSESSEPENLNTVRERVQKLDGNEVSTLVKDITKDIRYHSLNRIARERHLRLSVKKSWGANFPGRPRVVFIPAFDANGRQSGFLAKNGEVRTLSLEVGEKDSRVLEAFVAELEPDGHVVVEAHVSPEGGDTHPDSGLGILEKDGNSCSYVTRTSFSFWCVDCTNRYDCSNPFGFSFYAIYRTGWSPSSPYYSPAWRSCMYGSLHVCPLYEYSGSPIEWEFCGFAPSHPIG